MQITTSDLIMTYRNSCWRYCKIKNVICKNKTKYVIKVCLVIINCNKQLNHYDSTKAGLEYNTEFFFIKKTIYPQKCKTIRIML